MNADYGASTELAGPLQQRRALYQPRLPPCLQGATVRVVYGDATTTIDLAGAPEVARAFPRTYGQPLVNFLAAAADKAAGERPPIRVGVVFSGRQSPGGHNVVWGLHDALKAHNPHGALYGFIGGTEGLFANKTLEITNDVLASYKNQGTCFLLFY